MTKLCALVKSEAALLGGSRMPFDHNLIMEVTKILYRLGADTQALPTNGGVYFEKRDIK